MDFVADNYLDFCMINIIPVMGNTGASEQNVLANQREIGPNEINH
jgi:hypothetical protein